jgi:alcohol dehydrogenase class IV
MADTSLNGAPEPFFFRHSARQVLFGPGKLSELATIAKARNVSRAVVVMDGFFIGGPLEARVREVLGNVVDVEVYGVPIQEPDTETVEACRLVLEEQHSDMVVAVGGGSTMDTAKVARILLSNPGTVEEMAGFERYYEPHRSAMVCVPTTAGTASEVSEMAVIGLKGSDIKLRYRSQNMTAQFAILDPELLLSAPPSVTANTGYDALTHAIESYISRGANIMSDPYALEAVRRLVKWLPVAYHDGDNLTARGHTHIGSMLAGVAFNSTQLGLAHAIAAPLGNIHHVVHGKANALALPAVIAYNESELGKKGQILLDILGSGSAAEGVAQIRADLDLDIGLDEIVTTDEDRETIVEAAMKSGNVPYSPREPSVEHIRAIVAAMRQRIGASAPVLEI